MRVRLADLLGSPFVQSSKLREKLEGFPTGTQLSKVISSTLKMFRISLSAGAGLSCAAQGLVATSPQTSANLFQETKRRRAPMPEHGDCGASAFHPLPGTSMACANIRLSQFHGDGSRPDARVRVAVRKAATSLVVTECPFPPNVRQLKRLGLLPVGFETSY